ncbi:saccharopine dehydrogenase NADP-binding domain-containing protein [Actinosynnema sp. NPDC047251]|uniref:Saccharopine dehydrogenase n=1 Tax=Saccharothrix espanaensis (strain ATCC 51144 / DSM 44229 / JCM 9112 / NBRC 15066 / NRRL 15764) TaxID=1179773 RepID=K0K0D3_SACES|nr:saccharopine dehydrogenase NADP-binding domain-containing protein [Saccharothrix espanaensis]CCH30359.1 Saccharopine dehydrogenase [Saccharothrix espanaensis DSM 44229]
MKVVALGGAGAVGAVAARVAAALPGVREVVVADLAGGVRVDIADGAALRDLLAPADVVLNAVGPFYRFGPAVLRAAIDTGTDYLDVCDDWEPVDGLFALDAAARAAGVRAVVGMGASPGASNLLAALAVRELAAVDEVHTAWPADGTLDGRVSAAVVHWVKQVSGRIAVVEGGEVVDRPPLRPVRLDLPGGLAGTAHTVGHPEPVMFHRTFRPVTSTTLMVAPPSTIAYLDVLRRDLDAGRLTPDTAAAALVRPGARRVLRSLARRFAGPGTLPPFFAVATGGGRTAVARLDHAPLTADMAEATGLPLALGLAQLSGVAPGVHPPEAAIDPERFFADLARHHPDVAVDVRVS